jgi:SAM-dependent methyltransferase
VTWEEAVRGLVADPAKADLVRQCYYDPPLINAARRFHSSEEWASIRRRLKGRSGRAMDVGAGNGIVSYALAADGWEVTAVEPCSSALVGAAAIRTLAEEARLPITVFEGLTDDLVVPAGHFDAILVRQVFHHAPDIDAFMMRLAELLAPGGLVVTWRDHVITQPEDLMMFFDRHPLHHQYGGENAFTNAQYRSAIAKAGLQVIETLLHFDDPLNYGPQTPSQLLTEAGRRIFPHPFARAMGAVLGSRPVFALLAPLLSALDRRPGRHVAFLATKKA